VTPEELILRERAAGSNTVESRLKLADYLHYHSIPREWTLISWLRLPPPQESRDTNWREINSLLGYTVLPGGQSEWWIQSYHQWFGCRPVSIQQIVDLAMDSNRVPAQALRKALPQYLEEAMNAGSYVELRVTDRFLRSADFVDHGSRPVVLSEKQRSFLRGCITTLQPLLEAAEADSSLQLEELLRQLAP
jgi:hypothetical protein